MSEPFATRLFGGSPASVATRLVLASLLVGALMSWLEIDPGALLDWVRVSLLHLWATGFQSLHQIGRYIAAGAAVVIPVWLLMRLTSVGPRRHAQPRPGRWDLPGGSPGEAGSQIRTGPRD